MTAPRDVCRLAVIGVGFGATVVAPAFLRDPRVRLAGFAASTADRARAAASRFEAPEAWDDWRAAIASPNVDAVAIAVPPPLQPDVIREAARLGKHVFCEKPLGVDRAAIEDLVGAVERAGVANAIDFEFTELASWRRARELLRAAAPRHFVLGWQVETRANRLGGHPWKTSRARGGGALLNFVAHVVYGIEWMMGRIVHVQTRLSPRGSEAEARVDAWLELENGVEGSISVATDAVNGSGFRLEAYGSKGLVRLENTSTDHLRNYVLSTGSEIIVDERGSAAHGDGRIEQVATLARRFVDAALGGEPARPSIADGARVTMVLDAMRAAHEEGTWQPIR